MQISRETFSRLKDIVKKNPTISNRELGRLCGIGKDTAHTWRDRDTYTVSPQHSSVEDRLNLKMDNPGERRIIAENRALKSQLAALRTENLANSELNRITNEISASRISVPKWQSSRKSDRKDTATACAFMSDWHLDEVVYKAQVMGCNEYNRKIAEVRCGQFFDNTVQLAKKYISGVQYDGLYLFMGGDIFSGNIHEELKETNEGTIIESILYWIEPIASGIRHLADNFNHVHIPCVVGNHGRLSRKPTMKNRAQENFDWLLYHMLAMQFKNDTRITWDISPSPDCLVKIHDTSFLFTHGDQFRGGSGISGLLSPLLLGDHRKRKRQAAVRQPYEYMVYGHWHSLVLGVRGLLGNGSNKGYDEFAFCSNFDFEPPQQALWLVQPRVGVTGRWPIHVLGDTEKY